MRSPRHAVTTRGNEKYIQNVSLKILNGRDRLRDLQSSEEEKTKKLPTPSSLTREVSNFVLADILKLFV
jgi:hypothetical protein